MIQGVDTPRSPIGSRRPNSLFAGKPRPYGLRLIGERAETSRQIHDKLSHTTADVLWAEGSNKTMSRNRRQWLGVLVFLLATLLLQPGAGKASSTGLFTSVPMKLERVPPTGADLAWSVAL